MIDDANRKSSYEYDDLIACGEGILSGPGNAQLPLPNMLMFDRISHISDTGGQYDKGSIVAEFNINPKLWFFDCHFKGDPVMPGCLGLDAMWQMLGFFMMWLKAPGKGRALGVGEVKFMDQVLPSAKKVVYEVNVKRVIMRRLVLGIADGIMRVDGKDATEVKDMRVGLFTG